jgi:3-dehydroquinate dehydratase-1
MKKVQIGAFELGLAPLVVGVVSSPRTIERPLDPAGMACDIVEFRIDLIGPDTPGWLERAVDVNQAGKPVILTVRHASEGGHWFLGEAERAAVYHSALPYVAAIDVEIRSESMDALASDAHAAGKTVIGSFHDFERTPDQAALRDIVKRGRAAGAAVVKVATVAKARADVERLASLLDERKGGPVCVLGMGEVGGAARVELARLGSCLVYGFHDQANAPGQMSCAELRKRLAST